MRPHDLRCRAEDALCRLPVGAIVRLAALRHTSLGIWPAPRQEEQDHIFLQSLSKLVDRACSARVMTCVAHMKLPDGAHHGDGEGCVSNF